MPPCTCAIAMARHTASNCENKMQQVVGNMIERPRAHSPACRLLKRVLQNSQMAVRGSLARAQRQWKCEAVSGSHALLSGRGKSQDRGAFNALHAKGGSGAPHAAHAQQMSKQAAKREAIRSGSLSDRLSVLGDSYCTCIKHTVTQCAFYSNKNHKSSVSDCIRARLRIARTKASGSCCTSRRRRRRRRFPAASHELELYHAHTCSGCRRFVVVA